MIIAYLAVLVFIVCVLYQIMKGIIAMFKKLFKKESKKKGRQVDKSINKEEIQQPITLVKEEIPEKRKKQFIGVWDSKRLLRELLEITESVKSWKIELYKTDSEKTPYKIRCKRVISVINAFNGCKRITTDWGYIPLDMLISEDYPEMKIAELTSLIVDFLPKYSERIKNTFSQDEEATNRMQLFYFLFRYRHAAYKLSTHWDGVSETDIVGAIAIDMTRKLYNEKIESMNETLDKLLLLLLDDKFNKTFTEKELLEDYGYPNVTDEELH